MSALITVFFWTQGIGQRAWMEIKEKWKTDGRKHATGTGIQAALYIIYQKEKGPYELFCPILNNIIL